MSDDEKTIQLDRELDGPEDQLYGPELAPSAIVGEYTILEKIAAGGWGTVYRAEHRVLGRLVAIKVLHSELVAARDSVRRFQREARAVNKIRHPNVVDIQDFGWLPDGRPYHIMELIDGKSLDVIIAREGRMQPDEVLALCGPICSALQAVHDAGLVHRDLKASNIAMANDRDPASVRVLDFGIAKLLDPGSSWQSSTNRVMGTPQTMAPEQIRGEPADARTDIYALGVVIYQMLSGQQPFGGHGRDLVERMKLSAEPPRLREYAAISPALEAVVLRMMSRDPGERYDSAARCLEALQRAISGTGRQPAASAPYSRPVLAIHLTTRLPPDKTGRELGDELLIARLDLLEEARSTLDRAGYAVPHETVADLVAIRPLSRSDAATLEPRTRALALAGELLALRSSDAEDMLWRDIELAVCVGLGTALMRARGSRLQILESPLLRLANWPEPRFGHQVGVMAPVVEGLDASPIPFLVLSV